MEVSARARAILTGNCGTNHVNADYSAIGNSNNVIVGFATIVRKCGKSRIHRFRNLIISIEDTIKCSGIKD